MVYMLLFIIFLYFIYDFFSQLFLNGRLIYGFFSYKLLLVHIDFAYWFNKYKKEFEKKGNIKLYYLEKETGDVYGCSYESVIIHILDKEKISIIASTIFEGDIFCDEKDENYDIKKEHIELKNWKNGYNKFWLLPYLKKQTINVKDKFERLEDGEMLKNEINKNYIKFFEEENLNELFKISN